MNALEFYKSHESAPLPNVDDSVILTVEELCELMEQYHQSKVNNCVLDDVSKRKYPSECPECGSDEDYLQPYDDEKFICEHCRITLPYGY